VINGLMLLVVGASSEFHVSGFWAAFWGALVVSLVSTILSLFIADSKRQDWARPPHLMAQR
jgi:putative membrane protein